MNHRQKQRGSLAFVGLLVVAAGFIYLAYWIRSPEFPLRKQNVPAEDEERLIAEGERYRVEITDKGFVPGVLRIKPYDSVTFVNRDAVAHYPVSGDISGRLACEEFGEGRELRYNEPYTVLFRTEDECAFHDKLNESFAAGTIFIERE